MQKGFTLIEVLAVLLILSVIALITTPIISGVIKNSRENAFVNDVNSLVDSLRTYQAENNYEAITIDYTNNTNTTKLEVDGELPDAGAISINEAGKIKLALWNEKLQICAKKNEDAKEITKEKITKAECKL